MARSMKKTAIAWGMVNIPVGVHKAVDSSESRFSQFHSDCNGSVGYTKTCKDCGEVLSAEQIYRGVKDDDNVIPVTDEELASVEVQAGTTISVEQFVETDEIEQIYIESHYYLEPAKESIEGYKLLRAAMIRENKIAIVKFVLRGNSQHLGILRPYGDKALILEGISYPKEIRPIEFPILDTEVELSEAMLDMAANLIGALTSPFDAGDYVDVYRERLDDLIAAKASGAEIIPMPTKPQEAAPSDLLAKLAASVETKKAAPAAKKAPYKAAAKKAPAKKVSA